MIFIHFCIFWVLISYSYQFFLIYFSFIFLLRMNWKMQSMFSCT
jgi:hypothetical protein